MYFELSVLQKNSRPKFFLNASQIISTVQKIRIFKPFLATTQQLQLSTKISIPGNALLVQGFPFHQQEQDSVNL